MEKAALRIEVDGLREKIIAFIRFLDSLDFSPEDLPRDEMRVLTEGDVFLQQYSEVLKNQKNLSSKKLAEIENHCSQLGEIIGKAKECVMNHILENLAKPGQKQFKNYNAYAQAEKAWYNYNNFVKKQGLEKISLERIQVLIDRAKNPALLFSVLLPSIDGLKVDKIAAFQEAMSVFTDLINHTPRSEFESQTPYQKASQLQEARFNKFREQRNMPSFSNYDFDVLFNKLGATDSKEKKTGQKMLKRLWENYVNEKHGKIKTKDKEHHKNIIALWDQVKQRFYKAESPNEKMVALKPFTLLWCTFIPGRFYPELKELMLKGIFDESGTVRYRIVRAIESIALVLSECAPHHFKDLFEAIGDEREAYMRKNKLLRSKNAYPENINNKTLRSLTQAQAILESQMKSGDTILIS